MNKKKKIILGILILSLVAGITVFVVKKIFISKPDAGAIPIAGQLPMWGEYHVSLPHALMLVDSQGRRTGKDPVSDVFYREIPNTSYGEMGGAGELFTSDLPNGSYTLYVLGGQIGSYWLDASHRGQPDQEFRGNIEAGSMIAYVQNYDTANLADSLFSYRAIYSSTASITSEPPHNLPPPPLPK